MSEKWEQFPAADSGMDDAGLEIPWATFGLLSVIVLVFLAEGSDCLGSGDLNPDLRTVVALGGLARPLVEAGQWFRLLTAPFLHWSMSHLFFNGLALCFAARLERVVGSAWFLAIFLVAAIGGSGLSMAINDPEIVSAGASGAILGLFGEQVVVAYGRFEKGDASRKSLSDTAWRILIPTLASYTYGSGGARLDFGAHLGGALTGAAACGALVVLWRRDDKRPPLAGLAWLVNAAGCLALIYAVLGPLRLTSCRAPTGAWRDGAELAFTSAMAADAERTASVDAPGRELP